MSFGCGRSCSSSRNKSMGGRGGDAKSIISPNTSFGDITMAPNKQCGDGVQRLQAHKEAMSKR